MHTGMKDSFIQYHLVMVNGDGCVACSEALPLPVAFLSQPFTVLSSCSFAGDASLPTAELPAELRSPDWNSLFSVSARKQKH